MAEGELRMGQGNSGEESRQERGDLGRAMAWTSYDRVWGTSRTNAEAQGRANSASHRAGLVDHHGRTPARPNWLRVGVNKENQTRE
jgi:hypothetical protein